MDESRIFLIGKAIKIHAKCENGYTYTHKFFWTFKTILAILFGRKTNLYAKDCISIAMWNFSSSSFGYDYQKDWRELVVSEKGWKYDVYNNGSY